MKKIIILLFIIPIIASAQKNVTWDFPVNPDTEEWNTLKDHEARINAMQIPTNILTEISTEELVIACINYPFGLQYGAYKNEYEGIIKIIEEFNGLSELMKRKDACAYLTEIYKNANAEGLTIKDKRIDERFWSLKFGYLELLICQDQIINSSDNEVAKTLLTTVVDKTNLKTEKTEHFSTYDLIISSFIITKILVKLKIEEFVTDSDYQVFTANKELQNFNQVFEIIEFGKKVCNYITIQNE